MTRRARLAWMLALTLALTATTAFARAGGGHSYSGGGSHSSGGGWSSGSSSSYSSHSGSSNWNYQSTNNGTGDPNIGVIITIIVVVVLVFVLINAMKTSFGKDTTWSTGGRGPYASSGERPMYVPVQTPALRRKLAAIRDSDPDFSLALFEDFLYSLYARAHAVRGSGANDALDHMAPWISANARAMLAAGRGNVREVKAIIVGSLHYQQVNVSPNGSAAVGVELEANYTEVAPNGHEQTFWVRETWKLARKTGAKSRPPERVKNFACPGCGAPLEAIRGNTCTRCERVLDTGSFDWLVVEMRTVAKQPRGPALTGTTEEEGTDSPTVFDADRDADLAALIEKDPEFTLEAFRARVTLVFNEIQSAWTLRQYSTARAFLSDSLFQNHMYWIETYLKQGLRNVTENSSISRIEMVRVDSDRWFDAITVRVHASGLDYTLDDRTKAVVGGSKSRPRAYTEYWTFLRGASAKGAPRSEKTCPGCGAALKVNMAGSCEFCGSKLVTGDFDWVLSRIEQDDDYEG